MTPGRRTPPHRQESGHAPSAPCRGRPRLRLCPLLPRLTRYLRTARRHRADGGAVATVLRPVRLRPQASPEGEPLVEVWARERGAAVAARLAADTSFGADVGLPLDVRRAVFTNTFDAHRLAAQASAQGKGEEMTERLFRAYFADGLNIADAAVLDRLATETGVTTTSGGADALQAELARAAAGVPAQAWGACRWT
ncbi:DsbA family protein [Streptomyces chrestomyceticus]|uniref:DsbA family protein n=1 Tax=Streptomyces chrestomyceticus TaxID=68185 RepID=UPI0039E0771F